MTKQEKIREQAILDLMEYKGFHRAPTEYIIDCVMRSLSRDGAVIKVEGELPSVFDSNEDVISALEYKKKLEGYVAVESLIEGGSEKC